MFMTVLFNVCQLIGSAFRGTTHHKRCPLCVFIYIFTPFDAHNDNNRIKDRYFGLFDHIVQANKNIIISLDRAHRFLLRTRIGDLQQVPRRIRIGFTRIGGQLYLRSIHLEISY